MCTLLFMKQCYLSKEKVLDKTLVVFWPHPWTSNYIIIQIDMMVYVSLYIVIRYLLLYLSWFWNTYKTKTKTMCVYNMTVCGSIRQFYHNVSMLYSSQVQTHISFYLDRHKNNLQHFILGLWIQNENNSF